MGLFEEKIKGAFPTAADVAGRRWVYVAYDRLTDRVGPLAEQPAEATGIVLIESVAKGTRRPYHKRKLVLLLSNMRHFALEQAARGCCVVYRGSRLSYGPALLELQQSLSLPELTAMQPAERELRLDLAQAVQDGLRLKLVDDATWLSKAEDFTGVFGGYKAGRSYVMDRFYRRMRQQSGILMLGGKPVGGQFSYDAENRRPYRGEVPVPPPPVFRPDAITEEVMALVERHYGNHFGSLKGYDLPSTRAESDAVWRFALAQLLPHFGPFEDAMRDDQGQLFHSRTSALVNLGRLLPADLVRDVEQAAQEGRVPLASAEGFIRQLLGWREFMRHLHRETDGYRLVEVAQEPQRKSGGKRKGKSSMQAVELADPHAGARPSALGAHRPLPAAYWGVASGMRCLDTVVAQVVEEGWSHHITRLMVLSNLATLCGFSPRELTDWFWIAYVDAYDWVVETNVLGMATYADGGVTATKPYVSGAAYIHRMSNYCGACQFDPKKSTGAGSCPYTALYWTFLERNRAVLGNNFRLQMPYRTLEKKSESELVQLRERAEEAVLHLESFAGPQD